MSALPKAVQKQVDTANKIIDEMQNPPKDPTENPPPQEPTQITPVNDPPPPAPTEEPPENPPTNEVIAHKYSVLQGKYNAEVPRLRAQIKGQDETLREMRQRLNNTESLLAGLQATRDPQVPPTVPPVSAVVTDEEIAQFGPDLIDVIERVAARKIMPEVASRFAASDTRVGKVEQNASHNAATVARSERDKVLSRLTEAVPDWEAQNEDDEFLAWLNEHDAYAGVPRGQLLTQAFSANDAERVIAFFKGFQTENAIVTPESNVTPSVPLTEPQQRLEDLVAPGTPKTGTTGAPNESGKRVWSRNDISSFYATKNEFITKGKQIPDEYVALEKDLFAAQVEGRLR